MAEHNISEDVWKWWESDEIAKNKPGVNWTFLEHNGPVFTPYKRIPEEMETFLYDNEPMSLSKEAEEVASFYAEMLNSEYTKKEKFNENFFKDWSEVMTKGEKNKIKEFSKCNFQGMHEYFLEQTEKNKSEAKKQNEDLEKKYGFCKMDGHKQKIINFKIVPGLLTGRGDNPKMGRVKRVLPEHVTINCSQDSVVPAAPNGGTWKEVVHQPEVAWLASWKWQIGDEESKSPTYMNFHPSSKVRGLADLEKYELARRLRKRIGTIRDKYTKDWESKEVVIKQRAVALYFIDKLALRVGNEKDEDEADTIGCCTLRVEHITLQQKDDKYIVHLNFVGKSSVEYDNEFSVEELVYCNLLQFVQNKTPEKDLFDSVSAKKMNEYLKTQMEGLTAKTFRTMNASRTLEEQLDKYDKTKDSPKEFYENANLQVAKLCNHQRFLPKNQDEIEEKRKSMQKQDNKNYALDSSKEDYLDPRITVAWCKKVDIDIKKIFSKSVRDRFCWAMHPTEANNLFKF